MSTQARSWGVMSERYPFAEIEPKWQQRWEEQGLFRAESHSAKPKFYVLDMFPYPSGAGLHVGHPEGYTATDIIARYKLMRGFNVLHPIGWDAFGLPAEQYAIETGTHPCETTRKNIATFKRQIQRLGFGYDWSREIDTTDPRYVRWTQWIFLQLHKRELAYTAEVPVWWCEGCGTVLANEEVQDGKCERKGHPVARRPMRQWMLKITAYADRLLEDLAGLDWPEPIKEMQRNWIGRSEGAEVDFAVVEGTAAGEKIRVFTTRPDTLFGATYLVLSPEHPLVERVTAAAQKAAVERYRTEAARKSELERTDLAKMKSGVFTGSHAVNSVNGERVPIWIADYVLASYGTGAIMAVPAHDQRDFEFARQYSLPIRPVIVPEGAPLAEPLEQAFEAVGRMHDSGAFSGLPSDEGNRKITEWLAARGAGKPMVNYKLRDWLFSRQRYWGEPIPIVHCGKCGAVPLPESALPLELPAMQDFRPTGTAEPPSFDKAQDGTLSPSAGSRLSGTESRASSRDKVERAPLARAAEWVRTTCPTCGGAAQRETNTMPQWAGSCWYYLRYLDASNDRQAWDPAIERYWMPVDLYIGGAEHAVLHLLYSRFWHKVLYDLKLVSRPEPFQKLVNQGMILGEDGEKMSKSRGNVVNPDDVVAEHGADAFRLYEMFMGPLEAVKPWSARSIVGIDRFLQRVWDVGVAVAGVSSGGAAEDASLPPHEVSSLRCGTSRGPHPQTSPLTQTSSPTDSELTRSVHATIKKVTEDLDGLRFNTAISSMMVLTGEIQDRATSYELRDTRHEVRKSDSEGGGREREVLGSRLESRVSSLAVVRWAVETLLQLLAPMGPHIAEELWERLGHRESIFRQPWPSYDATLLHSDTVELVVQVNGKVRSRVTVPVAIGEEELRQLVFGDEQVKRWLDGKSVRQFVIVPKRLVNLVI